MPETDRPIDEKIRNAVERMKRVQDAAKGLRETGQIEQTVPRTVERQTPSR